MNDDTPLALTRDELSRNMMLLDDALQQIARTYSAQVSLEYEDPEAFGAGHYVLYSHSSSTTRFVIEEQYNGSDWSDVERVPTSWTWRTERQTPGSRLTRHWQTRSTGNVASQDVAQLITRTHTWARAVQYLAVRAQSITPATLTPFSSDTLVVPPPIHKR